MRYAQIRDMDISNGEGIGITLFVQGCHFHCKNCFNKETWDFNGGSEYLPETYKYIEQLANQEYITRFSILGGEPLADKNVEEVYKTVNQFKKKYNNKNIWLYTGYTYEEIINGNNFYRKEILKYVDFLIDGRYVDDLKNYKLLFRGSSNQRIINVQQSLKSNEVILWNLEK